MTEWFGLAVVTTMCNYITPFSGGLLFRATYLKRQHAFSFTKFVTLLSANYLISFWVIAVTGLFCFLFLEPDSMSSIVFLFFLGTFIAISCIALIPVKSIPGTSKFIRIINNSLHGWLFIKRDKILLIKLIVYTLANILLNSCAFWVACNSLDYNISLLPSIIISLIASFSVVIKLTPANLGIHEAIIGFTSPLFGIEIGQGLMTALVLRGTGIIVLFILGPLYSYILTKKLRIFSNIEQAR